MCEQDYENKKLVITKFSLFSQMQDSNVLQMQNSNALTETGKTIWPELLREKVSTRWWNQPGKIVLTATQLMKPWNNWQAEYSCTVFLKKKIVEVLLLWPWLKGWEC